MPASLPDNSRYCFCPFSDADGEPPQLRILVEGLDFAIPTALVALTTADGLVLADRLRTPPRSGNRASDRRAAPASRGHQPAAASS